MRTLVFSPHLDDAVLSIGNVLAGAPPSDVTVATVFAGTPRDRRQLRSFDERSGFASASQALDARRAEDKAALRLLGARALHFKFTDGQYGEGPPPRSVERIDAIVDLMAATVRSMRPAPSIIVGPLGVAHPDHRDVGDAYLRLVWTLDPAPQCWVYEDLPGRVLDPEEAVNVLAHWWRMPTLSRLDAGVPHAPWPDSSKKVQAIECYRSQAWALEPVWHPTLCPERLWQVIR